MTLGEDEPDARGRSGLHLTGRDLARNPDIRILDVELLATAWHVLRRTTFEQRDAGGAWVRKTAETYDRGDGAVILLYDRQRRTVLLTRQFRYPRLGHRAAALLRGPVLRRDGAARRGRARARGRADRGGRAGDRRGGGRDRHRDRRREIIMLLQWAVLRGPFA